MADMQRSLNLSVSRGALVQDVDDNSPAQRAGLRPYDVILTVDGREVWTNEELIRDISGRQPGTTARLDVLRDGHRESMTVKLTERPVAESSEEPRPSSRRSQPASAADSPLGLVVRELDPGFMHRLEIPSSVHGVVVFRVDPAGPAFVPSMRRGFVIMEINRQPVRSVGDFDRIVGSTRTGDALAFYGYDPSVGKRAIVMATVDAR